MERIVSTQKGTELVFQSEVLSKPAQKLNWAKNKNKNCLVGANKTSH